MSRRILGRGEGKVRRLLVGTFQSTESASRVSTIAAGQTPDDYKSKLLKLIPAEVVSLFLALDAILKSSSDASAVVYWAVFGVAIIANIMYLLKVAGASRGEVVVSVLALALWAYVLGGPFMFYGWYRPLYGSLALPVFTFLVPLLF